MRFDFPYLKSNRPLFDLSFFPTFERWETLTEKESWGPPQPAQTLFKTKNWKADIAGINMTNDRWKMITCSSLFAALPSNWQQEILIHIFFYFPCPSKNYFNANQNSQKNVGYKYHKALSLSHVDWENSD